MDQDPLSTTDAMLDWMETLIAYVRSGDPDLTNRQMAIIFTVYTRRGPHTVRGLAERLKESKPVITRALNKWSAPTRGPGFLIGSSGSSDRTVTDATAVFRNGATCQASSIIRNGPHAISCLN